VQFWAHCRNAITLGEYRDAGSARTCLDVDYRDTSDRHRRNSAINCGPRGRPGLSIRWQWAVDERNGTQPDRNPTGKEIAAFDEHIKSCSIDLALSRSVRDLEGVAPESEQFPSGA